MGAANALNISQQGVTYFDGIHTFSGVDGSDAGKVLTSNGTGLAPSFQAVSSSGAITSITGSSGGAQVPLLGNFNILGSGSITVAGSANTETVQLTGLTNHSVLVGAGTTTITKVSPSATSGIPLVSNGSSLDPSFTTAVVAGGGTGLSSTTAYGLITGGTTSTGNFQNAGTGTSGQFYVSGGSAALGTWTTQSLRHIETIEAQGQATFDFTTGISSSDNTYLFIISRLSTQSDAQPVKLLVSTDGGSSYLVTNYVSGITYNPYNAATWTNQNSTTFYYVAYNASSSGSVAQGGGWILFSNGTNGNASSIHGSMSWNLAGADMVSGFCTGRQTATTVNAFRFLATTGNLNAKISLFAVN